MMSPAMPLVVVVESWRKADQLPEPQTNEVEFPSGGEVRRPREKKCRGHGRSKNRSLIIQLGCDFARGSRPSRFDYGRYQALSGRTKYWPFLI